jgi:hypothetical protein
MVSRKKVIPAYRKPKPRPTPAHIKPLAINLNVGGALTLSLVPAPLPPPPLKAVFTVTFEGFQVKGDAPMAYTLPVDKMVVVAVQYADTGGNVVDLPQGNVHWETSEPTILDAQPDASDDQQCSLTPAGTVGNAQVTCTGSNPDGSQVIATLDITVVAGDAVSGTIQPTGEPQPIEPHAEQHARKR